MKTTRSYFDVSAYLALLSLVTVVACTDIVDDSGEAASERRRAMLESQVDRVILPTLTRLLSNAQQLSAAATTYAAAVRLGPASTEQMTLRAAFRQTSQALQEAELFQFGPYGTSSAFVGGEDLRDEVYSWPVRSRCRVDQETIEGNFRNSNFFDSEFANVFGMDALERLIFAESPANACSAPHIINTSGAWAALTEQEIRIERADYAVILSAYFTTKVQELVDRWSNGFADEVKTAGLSDSDYSSTQAAVDDVFAALFYIETEVKDTKLGAPLRITSSCSATGCTDLLESQDARLSLEWVRANLISFQSILLGGESSDTDAVGFVDLLEDVGATELADELRQLTQQAIQAADRVPTPLRDNLDSEEAAALYTAVQAITTPLKTQFVSVLALRVPDEGAADND